MMFQSPRERCVKAILNVASTDEIIASVCDQLRGRDALWRADAPIKRAAIESAAGIA